MMLFVSQFKAAEVKPQLDQVIHHYITHPGIPCLIQGIKLQSVQYLCGVCMGVCMHVSLTGDLCSLVGEVCVVCVSPTGDQPSVQSCRWDVCVCVSLTGD